jgi:chromate transporter
VGWLLLPAGEVVAGDDLPARVPRRVGVVALALFFGLLLALPAFSAADGGGLAFVEAFYRSGALVFGGGHVVLPLLEASVVRPGWVTPDAFLAGYGVAQAVPGPLFTFSAYLGAVARVGLNPWVGALVALVSIFLPAFLLVVGVLPFWGGLRVLPRVRSALRGVNAAVVGILLAALYSPVFTAAVGEPRDFAFALAAFGLLAYGRLPPWLVVGLAAAAGWLLL